VIALIPARSGSKRIPHKNVKLLGGVPLMCWTISVARKSGLFEKVVVSTDSIDYCRIATAWDADAILRPAEISGDKSTDPEWVLHAFDTMLGPRPDAFALLRPTAPFRTVATLKRAVDTLIESGADSIRAVQKCKEHPYKMWVLRENRLLPLFPLWDVRVQQSQSMPEVYWQNASLEMAWTRVLKGGTITGYTIAPFLTSYLEGFDINSPKDWAEAEYAVSTGNVEIPR